jgi:aconitate hydratase
MYLGVESVLAQSFARIHKTNLFNFGIVPLSISEATYERIEQGDEIEIVDDAADAIAAGAETFTIRINDEWEATAGLEASPRERQLLVDGGKLPHTKRKQQ